MKVFLNYQTNTKFFFFMFTFLEVVCELFTQKAAAAQ